MKSFTTGTFIGDVFTQEMETRNSLKDFPFSTFTPTVTLPGTVNRDPTRRKSCEGDLKFLGFFNSEVSVLNTLVGD